MARMKKLSALLLLALVALAAGCKNYVIPTTAGLHVDLVSLQQAGAEVRATWRVRNPNVVAYVLTQSSHRITLDGVQIGTVTDKDRIGVPSQNEVERSGVLVPASPAAREAINQAITKGSGAYALESTLWMLVLDDKTEKFTRPSSGTIPVTAK
jgi:LEA14-like dessication related protein